MSLDTRSGAAPSPMAPDALLEQQWHLKDRSDEVGGANVRDAWPISVGTGIVIGIVDDGIQWTHPDLSPNYLASASFDFNFNDSDPQPFSTSAHGTAVAGVAAARGDNTIGVSGVAPQASLAGLRLTAMTPTDSQEASAFGFQTNTIHILNNSWNPTDNGTTLKAPGTLAAAARQSAVTTGRNGKGRIFVWSSGNGRLVSDDCNFDGYANSRYAIAVGASTDGAVQVSTSEGCSALMVLAPSGGGLRALTTADLIGTPGYDGSDYTSAFGGTSTGGMSAAAPTVSGAVALMLARNQNLTWRDVQHILRRTSVRILPTDAGWTTGAFPHNERLGFGLLDAKAAVDLAGQWTNVPSEEALPPVTRTLNWAIPDINNNGLSDTITIGATESNFVIEHIEVDINVTHTWRGDLQVKLTSPSGVVSTLAPIRPADNGDNLTNWKFGSVRHWGESAAGTWTLNVADKRFQDTGTWNNWTLRIYGYHSATSAPGAFGKSSPASGATGMSTSPTLNWSASSGATSYEYCYDTTNDNACSAWTNNGANTSAGLSGLTNGATYYWQVRASNAGGITYAQGASAAFWSFSTGSAPVAFAKSSPADDATGQALTPTVSWGASSGATSYEYCYDTTNDNACSGWTSVGANTSVGLSGLTAGTTYYWQARANNGAGVTYANGAAASYWSFTTIALPGTFGKSSPANGATGQPLNPTLSWGASAGAANYDYCYDTTNDNACSNWIGAGASTSVGLSGLTAGIKYYWQVRAVNGGGTAYANGAVTAFWSFTTGTLPGALAKSSPADDATGQALTPTVSWGASSGATSYEYCYDTTNDNACSGWTSVGANTSVGLSGLTAGTTYYWQARANNGAGVTYANGAAASYWSFTTIALPGTFGKSTPANGAAGQSLTPTLSWGSSAGVANYDYCYDTTNDNACSNWLGAGASTSVGLSGLTAGITYYWQVRAVNGGGTTYANGAATAFWSFTTGTLPGAFVKSSPANGAAGQALTPTVSWGASSGATSYEYCYDTSNDNACSGWTSVGASTSAGLSGLTAGTTYYWQARANNGAGAAYANGAATSYWSFTTIALPGTFGKSTPANGATGQSLSPTVSWGASAGAANYDYCYDTTNDNACSNWIGAGASTSVPLSGLTIGTTYYWQVRAINGGGTTYANGAATAFWSFTTKPKPQQMVDLNGDGDGDVFTYNPATGAWARQVTLSSGGFSTTLGSWSARKSVMPARFNDDALTDFFVFDAVTGEWSKMLNTGTGFSVQATSAWWPGWQRFVTDLDGDGISDLFLYDSVGGQWYRSLSTPTGFTYTTGFWNPGWEVTPMNLNGDALGDLFLFDRATGRWFWVVSETDGSFTYPQVSYWEPDWAIYPGDFNGDGRTDLFLYRAQEGEYYVAITGTGFTYANGSGWMAGWTPTVADLNADGKSDLFLYSKETGLWFEMQGTGTGQFTAVGQGAWTPDWEILPTDFNDNGRADLVLFKPGTGEWFQSWNHTTGTFSYVGGQWQAGLTIVSGWR